jgi:hypothetical protein
MTQNLAPQPAVESGIPVADAMERDIEKRFVLVDQSFESLRSDLSRDSAASELKLTVKLGSMMVAGFGLMIAAMRLWA